MTSNGSDPAAMMAAFASLAMDTCQTRTRVSTARAGHYDA